MLFCPLCGCFCWFVCIYSTVGFVVFYRGVERKADKEHHPVWQMLQRGFGENRGKDHHIWVYCKGAKPKQKGTGNFGVDRYVYGPEGSETDTSIAKFENSVQGGIQDARKMNDGAELNRAFAAPLIAHLEMRSNFLRSELSNMIKRMFAALNDHFRRSRSGSF